MDYSQYNFESLPQRAPLDKVNSTSSSAAESTTEKQQTSEIASQPSVGPSTSFFDSFMNTYPIVPIPENLEFSEQRPCDFEYLDNTADIQIHSWGKTFPEALEQATIAMFGYMTPIEGIQINKEKSPRLIKVKGRDVLSLVFHFLDECLALFSIEYFLIRDIRITSINMDDFSLEALAFGEFWDNKKHKQGTEIKAITYSNMQTYEADGQHHICAILDI